MSDIGPTPGVQCLVDVLDRWLRMDPSVDRVVRVTQMVDGSHHQNLLSGRATDPDRRKQRCWTVPTATRMSTGRLRQLLGTRVSVKMHGK